MERFASGFRLAGYGAAYFFAAGAFMSYWPVWLRDRGVTDSEIGTLFMSRQLVSVRVGARHRLPRAPHWPPARHAAGARRLPPSS